MYELHRRAHIRLAGDSLTAVTILVTTSRSVAPLSFVFLACGSNVSWVQKEGALYSFSCGTPVSGREMGT